MANRRGVTELWPTYVQTAGAMREHQTVVAAVCSKCRTWMKVDLEAIIQRKGRSFSLIDQQGPCRVWQCDGTAFFMWSPGKGVPLRPLVSERGVNARMFGRVDVGQPPDDDDPEPPQRPPPVSLGVDPVAWGRADDRERKRLVKVARG